MSTLYTAGVAQLPYGYFGKIVGTYSDDTTRVIDVVLEKVGDFPYFPLFSNQPVEACFMDNTDGDVSYVGLITSKLNPDDNTRMILTIDRGFSAEFSGSAQPVSYDVPLEGGQLGICSAAASGMEAAGWAKVAHTVIVSSAGAGNIFASVLNEMEVTETDPVSMSVLVVSGATAVADGVIIQSNDDGEAFLLEPTWVLPTQAGWQQSARIYLNPLNGEISAIYGAARNGTPVDPTYPANAVKLAQVNITQGNASVVDEDITDERKGLGG